MLELQKVRTRIYAGDTTVVDVRMVKAVSLNIGVLYAISTVMEPIYAGRQIQVIITIIIAHMTEIMEMEEEGEEEPQVNLGTITQIITIMFHRSTMTKK